MVPPREHVPKNSSHDRLSKIIYSLNQLNPVQRKPFSHHLRTFDFLGLACMLVGVVLLLVGFNQSEISWSKFTRLTCEG